MCCQRARWSASRIRAMWSRTYHAWMPLPVWTMIVGSRMLFARLMASSKVGAPVVLTPPRPSGVPMMSRSSASAATPASCGGVVADAALRVRLVDDAHADVRVGASGEGVERCGGLEVR